MQVTPVWEVALTSHTGVLRDSRPHAKTRLVTRRATLRSCLACRDLGSLWANSSVRTTTPSARDRRTAFSVTMAIVAACMMAVLGVVPPAAAEDTIGISARPGNAEGVADGRTRFSFQTETGARIDDYFLVSNTGNVEQIFTVLATDAFNDEDGEFSLLATSEEPAGIGHWVTFENGSNRIEFTLAPGENRLLPFSVDVPENATPGDHAGGLLASVVTPGAEVTLDRRVGTRLYARVAGQLQPQLSISALDAEYLGDWWNPFDGTVRMYYTVRNVGNVALATNTSFGVDTWFAAAAAGPSGDGLPEILPGGARNVTVDVPGVAALLYLAPWVELKPFVDSPDPENALPVVPSSRSAFLLAVPWPLLILLAVVAAGLMFNGWRRRREDQRAEEWERFTARQVDDADDGVEPGVVGSLSGTARSR